MGIEQGQVMTLPLSSFGASNGLLVFIDGNGRLVLGAGAKPVLMFNRRVRNRGAAASAQCLGALGLLHVGPIVKPSGGACFSRCSVGGP